MRVERYIYIGIKKGRNGQKKKWKDFLNLTWLNKKILFLKKVNNNFHNRIQAMRYYIQSD